MNLLRMADPHREPINIAIKCFQPKSGLWRNNKSTRPVWAGRAPYSALTLALSHIITDTEPLFAKPSVVSC